MSTKRHSLVVGAGTTGTSVLRHLADQDELTLIDSRGLDAVPVALRERFAGQVRFLPPADLPSCLGTIDRAIVSPGLPLDDPLLKAVEAAGVPQLTDIDLFFDAVGDAPVVSITGTNGKSTVTALTAALLVALGRRVGAGGNLGPAALDLLQPPADCYVLELSSFQLARSRVLPHQVATVLNLKPDHLDYHGSFEAYGAAKQRIYESAAHCVCPADDALAQPRGRAADWKVRVDEPGAGEVGIAEHEGVDWFCARIADQAPQLRPLAPVSALQLAGTHNLYNAAAALALVLVLEPSAATAELVQGLAAFRGLPHRCELINTVNGVRFINDSKATNVGATVAAVEGLRQPAGQLLLLLGGDGKGADFRPLAAALTRGVRAALVYGASADELEQALTGTLPVTRCHRMTDALDQARRLARAGDTVLLSPACASFDQFRNFEARGDAFRDAVGVLAA